MDGLHQVSSVFVNNLNHFSNIKPKFTEHQLMLLDSWPEKVLSYLDNPGENNPSDILVKALQDEALPKKLMKGVAPALINLLKAVYISEKEVNREARLTVATAEDISIELPADINQELLEG
ncbi:MAG: hypothetical protein O7D86_05865 [Proteobacteria bacterium]|nr:hypothetical protein [Pseudomonadota bacterium]